MGYETREVLAGAYPRKRESVRLTHLAEVGSDVSLCKRTTWLADSFSLSEEERKARPTCERCGRKWDKLQTGA